MIAHLQAAIAALAAVDTDDVISVYVTGWRLAVVQLRMAAFRARFAGVPVRRHESGRTAFYAVETEGVEWTACEDAPHGAIEEVVL